MKPGDRYQLSQGNTNMARQEKKISKDELFANAPVLQVLAAMAVPTIISQLINLSNGCLRGGVQGDNHEVLDS